MNSADFAEIVAVTREFIRGKVVPAENLIEENDEVPDDIRQTAKDMGQAMKQAMAAVDGRADGKRVSGLVRASLQG